MSSWPAGCWPARHCQNSRARLSKGSAAKAQGKTASALPTAMSTTRVRMISPGIRITISQMRIWTEEESASRADQIPGLPRFPVQQLRSSSIIHEFFGFGMPVELLAGFESDITQVCDGRGSMSNLYLCRGFVARAHALDEVRGMQLCGIGGIHVFALERRFRRACALRLRIDLVTNSVGE